MQKLLIATKNPGKFREIKEALREVPFELLFLGDLGVDDSGFVEDGASFDENAIKKARFFASKTGFMTVGEDSGIIVEALTDELGVKTRRWGAGEGASDEEWLEFFMKRMEGEANRAAKFTCSAYLADGGGDGDVAGAGGSGGLFFRGETHGVIASSVMAPVLPGIPLSSVFVPEGSDKVYAALSTAEKNRVSHRGKAMAQLRDFLITSS